MLDEIRAGVSSVRSTRSLWSTLLSVAAVNAFVFNPISVLIPFFLRHDLHYDKAIVGYAFAVSGLTSTLNALVAANLKTPRRRVRIMWTF